MRGLLVAGLLALCVSLLGAAVPAAAAGPRPHRHIPRMPVQQQKAQSALQEQKGQPQGNAEPEQIPPTPPLTPLLPACVPKYVTDLVIPPPMPVSAVPMSLVVSERRCGCALNVGAAVVTQ